ncbi:CAP domain-containing protein [Aerococcus urinae]
MEFNKKLLLGLSAVGLGVFGLSDQVQADEYDDYDDIYEDYDYDDYDDYDDFDDYDDDDYDYDDYDDYDDDWDDDDDIYYLSPSQNVAPAPAAYQESKVVNTQYQVEQVEIDDDDVDDYDDYEEVNHQDYQVQAIDGSAALQASLSHSGLAQAQIQDVEIEMDEEDGRLVYEVEFEHGAIDYEYLIDGLNAAVVDYEYDHDDDYDEDDPYDDAHDDDLDDDRQGNDDDLDDHFDDDWDDDSRKYKDKGYQGQNYPQPQASQRPENAQKDSKTDQKQGPSRQGQAASKKPADNQPVADQNSTSQPEVDPGVSLEEEVVAHFHDLVNAERQSLGLTSLSYGNAYQAASDIRTKEIIDVFSHTRPNGQAFNTASGFEGAGNYVGENIQQSYAKPGTSPQAIAQDLFDNWKASPGHYENMIDPGFNSQAIGLEFVKDGDYILVYSAQILGQ